MARPTMPARVFGTHFPKSAEDSETAIAARLNDFLLRIRQDRIDEVEGDFDHGIFPMPARITKADRARIQARAQKLWQTRKQQLTPLSHLKSDDRKMLLAAAPAMITSGVVSTDQVDEIMADIHADYPWLAKASTAVMNHMRLRALSGPVPAHLPPLILLGAPGIAKSSWARDLGRAFGLTEIAVDIGATNGGTFTISGVERGWGSAQMGRVVSTMLHHRIANPLVILDEIDKIPTALETNKGNIPGAYEVLKSMIEPTTARAWICPYLQIPVDLTGVSWIMTTNSIDQMPTAFLDRCKVIRLDAPTLPQLMLAGRRMISQGFPDDQFEDACEILEAQLTKRGAACQTTSLRSVARLVEVIQSYLNRPRLV